MSRFDTLDRALTQAVFALALAIAAAWVFPALAGDPAAAMARVLEEDAQLGATRNHASETGPIAEAIRRYVAGLDALDVSDCPEAFVHALGRHRSAWEQSVAFFEQFPELRGELHDVFEMIRTRDEASSAGLEAAEAGIWSTWAEVEAVVEKYAPPGKAEPGSE